MASIVIIIVVVVVEAVVASHRVSDWMWSKAIGFDLLLCW